MTVFDARIRDGVLVCGSHAGSVVAEYCLANGAAALIANDAGVGKENAGVAGLQLLDAYGCAGASVDCWSARIGDGRDSYDSGIISTANGTALSVGIRPGMLASEAATLLSQRVKRDAPSNVRLRHRGPIVFSEGPPRIIGLDSASMVTTDFGNAIVVTGSHGGTVAGVALRARTLAAFFNDAGVGKDAAGISRLARLELDGIPAGTVTCTSARIGDAVDTFENGVLSYLNESALKRGLRLGEPVREAAKRLGDAS